MRTDSGPRLQDVRDPGRALTRILARVEIVGACWLWTGAVETHMGYGRVGIEGRVWAVHRFVQAMSGESIDGDVMHTCDTPRCCRPAHLVTATHAVNMADAATKGRMRHTVLTPAAVAVIRSRRATRAALALRFGVSIATIDNVLRGATWRAA